MESLLLLFLLAALIMTLGGCGVFKNKIFTLFFAIIIAPVVSYLTGFMVVGRDFGQIHTVGEIQRHGFPIWFHASAPGYSILSGLQPVRFLLNTLAWAIILISLGVVIHCLTWRSKKQKSLP